MTATDLSLAYASRGRTVGYNVPWHWTYRRNGTWDRLRGRGRNGVPGRAKRQRGYNDRDLVYVVDRTRMERWFGDFGVPGYAWGYT